MIELFQRGPIWAYLGQCAEASIKWFESKPEDEVLSRTTEDLVSELVRQAQVAPLKIGSEPVDGGVVEGVVTVPDGWGHGRMMKQAVFNLHAVYEFEGDEDLLYYQPSTSLAFTTIKAEVRPGVLTVRTVMNVGSGLDAAAARRSLDQEIGKIRTNVGHSANDVRNFNSSVAGQLRPAVERRKSLIQGKRELAGALGFPLTKRSDAPTPVPLRRKAVGVQRSAAGLARAPYREEWALTDAQYEDAIHVVTSAMLSMERTPSVVLGKGEEDLRDHVLVALNGTFEGTATGETFVKNGKTDILIRVEDRHVFVGECKWWKGLKALSAAIDQLLGYLPWRDEKAALIVFIQNKDASAVFDKVENAIKSHPAFKRSGKSSADPTKRRNFVLGHPEDPEREIQLAALFAVLPRTDDA